MEQATYNASHSCHVYPERAVDSGMDSILSRVTGEKEEGQVGEISGGRPSQRLDRAVQQVFGEFGPQPTKCRDVRGVRIGALAELTEKIHAPPLLPDRRKAHGKVAQSRRAQRGGCRGRGAVGHPLARVP